MSDERTRLRADLEAGRWQRLTDPLLPLVLLDDPGDWWPEAVDGCAVALLAELTGSDRGINWSNLSPEASDLVVQWQRTDDVTVESCALVVRALRLLVSRRPDLVPVVEVLERWTG